MNPSSKTQGAFDKTIQGTNLPGALLFIILGGIFGFLLSRAGATTYDFYAKLFLFQDFQLVWVIGVAAVTGLLGNLLFKASKAKTVVGKVPIEVKKKPWMGSLVPGSLIFGIGWGIAGACPGTALAMLGEGKLGSIITIAGFLIGTLIYGVFQDRKLRA